MHSDLAHFRNERNSRRRKVLRQVGILSLVGIGLFCFVLFSPDSSDAQGVFFLPALQTSWSHLFDLAAVWSSIKIILFSVSLFLIIESAGTLLAVFRLKSIAMPVFFMQALPCASLLCGSYYLLKSFL